MVVELLEIVAEVELLPGTVVAEVVELPGTVVVEVLELLSVALIYPDVENFPLSVSVSVVLVVALVDTSVD